MPLLLINADYGHNNSGSRGASQCPTESAPGFPFLAWSDNRCGADTMAFALAACLPDAPTVPSAMSSMMGVLFQVARILDQGEGGLSANKQAWLRECLKSFCITFIPKVKPEYSWRSFVGMDVLLHALSVAFSNPAEQQTFSTLLAWQLSPRMRPGDTNVPADGNHVLLHTISVPAHTYTRYVC